jgi:hypothetical protein
MEAHKDLKTLLNDALELRNVNHEKLAQLTGVPERFLWAIQNLEIDKLPSLPYVRGYIKKISEVLDLNHEELWGLYKKELGYKTSGAYDKLPTNRFAIKHLSKNSILLGALGLLLILYLATNFARLIGKPNLIITYPNESVIATLENPIVLTGRLNQKDKLTINGEEIFINSDGSFLKEYTLQPGANNIEFKAKRLLGKEITVIRQIIYQ